LHNTNIYKLQCKDSEIIDYDELKFHNSSHIIPVFLLFFVIHT